MNEEAQSQLRRVELSARTAEDLLQLQNDFVQVSYLLVFL
jgi:hypothetical protein